jgi:ABC-type transport system involved in multi-copper enzyme maturation permease subunit
MTTPTVEHARTARPPGGEPASPSLLRLARIELRKAYDTRAGFWLLLVVALGALAVVLLQVFFDDTPSKTLGDYFATSQLPPGILLPVVGILLVTSEWSQRTAMTTFALVPRRSRVLTAKLLAAAALAAAGVLAAGIASVLATALTPLLTDAEASWTISGAQVGQVLLFQVISVLIGVGLGMLLLSSPIAIVLYFVLPTIFTILTNVVTALSWMRDWLDFNTTSQAMFTGDLAGEGWARLATSVLLWLGVPLVAGWIRILRSEIS